MKTTHERIVRMDSDTAIIRNEQNSSGKEFILPDGSPGYRLPLIIRNGGIGEDRAGFSVARSGSRIFGVELGTKGNQVFVQCGREYLIEPGSVAILRRGSDHVYTPGPAGFVEKYSLGFTGSLIDVVVAALGLDGMDTCRIGKVAGFKRFVNQAMRLTSTGREDDLFDLAALAFETLLFVSRRIIKPEYPPAILAAISHMQSNLSGKISVKELCGAAGLGLSQFFIQWRKHLAVTPIDYLRSLRMKHAAALLEHTAIPIKDISYQMGYEDLPYFSNVFKKEIGVSPRAFRKRVEGRGAYS